MRTKSRGSIDATGVAGWSRKIDLVTLLPISGKTVLDGPKNTGRIETITYDDSKRKGNHRTTRYCDHSTVEAEGRRTHQMYQDSPSSGKEAYYWFYPWDLASLNLPDVSAYHVEALDFFKAGCQEKTLDLALNIWEFAQVKSLLPGIITTFKKFRSALIRKSVKQTLKASADTHLTYSFGVAPLVSDIKALLSSILGLQERIDFLRKNNGKPIRVDFRKDLSHVLRPGVTTLYNNSYEVAWVIPEEFRCTYHAFATVIYDVSQLSGLELALRLLTKQFGLDKPLTVIWNHLPWTFVIDWVYSVSHLLDGIQPTISLPVRFQDLGYSVKITQKDLIRLDRKLPLVPNTRAECSCKRTRYVRHPGLPISFSSVPESNTGLRQLALSMSLSLQKWR